MFVQDGLYIYICVCVRVCVCVCVCVCFIESKLLLHSLEQAAGNIGLHVNANKTEYISFKREGAISTWSCKPLKLLDKFIYFRRNVSCIESDVIIYLTKAWTAREVIGYMEASYFR